MNETMKRYMKPFAEIIPVVTAENLLLKGSDDVAPLNPGDPVVVGGDDDDTSTPVNRSLWDED